MEVLTLPLDSVHLDPANVRRHPARNIAAIRASLARFGQQRPILIDAKGVVRAGNGTVEAARALGWTEIRAVRTGLKGSEATAYAIADNRTAELAEWEDVGLASTLQALKADDIDLDDIGFSPEEIDKLLGRVSDASDDGDAAEDPGPQVDRAEELLAKWGCEAGQLWVIPSVATAGHAHRVVCGDCRDAATLARLCTSSIDGAFTSPPYAEQRKGLYGGVPVDRYVEWWDAVQDGVRSVLAPHGAFFVNIKAHCEGGERSLYVMDLACAMKRRWGWRFVDEFCWRNINNGVPGKWDNRLKNAWEPVYHFDLGGSRVRHESIGHESDCVFDYSPGHGKSSTGTGFPDIKALDTRSGLALPSNVIELASETKVGDHPAPFPVGLPGFFMAAFSDRGDTWLDPFLGSGTTIVAAEQTGRLCFGIEIAPKYVAVILERLAGMGLQPELVDQMRA